jgi:glycyl-tRNA synthetase beta chain
MQGAVRILMDLPELTGMRMEIGLEGLCERAGQQIGDTGVPWGDVDYFRGFVAERGRFALEQRGYPIETVRAVTQHWDVSPFRARRIADALQDVRQGEDFLALAVLFKRVKNIAKELDAGAAELAARQPSDRSRLTEPAEQALLQQLDARRPAVQQAVAAGDYRRALTEISALRPAVDRFFTEVFVMVDDVALKTARLTLMAELRDLVLQLADISEIVPQSES